VIGLFFAFALFAQDATPAANAAPAPPPPDAAKVQTTGEWVAWCNANLPDCQADLGRYVVGRAGMVGQYGCANITDDKITAEVLKWLAKHPQVNDTPSKQGLTQATQAIWPCLKPKFQGRIP
jgi:hypothetical protein